MLDLVKVVIGNWNILRRWNLFTSLRRWAIDEAVRVTKTGGVIFFAFLSVHGILYCNFLNGNFETGSKINLDDDFNLYRKYHLLNCERRELLGNSSHLLYIAKKFI